MINFTSHEDVNTAYIITKKKDFLKLVKSNKYKCKEDVRFGIKDALLDCLERYSKSE